MSALVTRAGSLAAEIWAPRERLSGSAWANAEGWIARGSGAAEGGPYSTDRVPYMVEILDVCCDEVHPEVVFNKPAQIGFTEVVNQVCGYGMKHDPSSILVIRPSDQDSKDWMKQKIDPMIAESPYLRGLIRSEGGRRSSDDTMRRKVYRNGWLMAVGANSPNNVRGHNARRLIGDERSGWTLDARNQGDPWDMGCERTSTFWNKKQIQGSTPGDLETCPITEAIAQSDRRRYHVTCPACGYSEEPFQWKTRDGAFRLVCDRDPANQLIPETAQYLCVGCGVLIPEYEKPRMTRSGRWVPMHPGRHVIGFDMGGGGGLMSPWQTWAEIIRKWNKAQRDPEKLKVFVTHVLGDPHFVKRERIEVHTLQARAEPLPIAPPSVGLLGVTVDVQKDRVETQVMGVAPQNEIFVLEWEAFEGDPATDVPWDAACAHIKAMQWGLPVTFLGFDTGYLPDEVWKHHDRWRARFPQARLFGVKGIGGPGRRLIEKPMRAKGRLQRKPWHVGTDTAKDLLLNHGVRVPVPPGGPGALHFASSLDPAWYEQFTSESSVLVRHGGRMAHVWRKRDPNAANETLDMTVYGLGCAVAMQTVFLVDVAALAAKRQEATVEAPPAPKPAPTNSWLGGRRGGWLRS